MENPKVDISENGTGYTRFEQTYHPHSRLFFKRIQLDARYCTPVSHCALTEEQAQIEVGVFETKGKRTYAQRFSLCLNPQDARKLALAICPSLATQSPLIRRDVDWYEDVTTSEYDNAIEHPLPFLEDVLRHIGTRAAFPNRKAYYDARECVNEAIQSVMAVDAQCECGDPGCPVHEGVAHCRNSATYTVYRVDMQDETGTSMCDKCAEDALDSGVFITRED